MIFLGILLLVAFFIINMFMTFDKPEYYNSWRNRIFIILWFAISVFFIIFDIQYSMNNSEWVLTNTYVSNKVEDVVFPELFIVKEYTWDDNNKFTISNQNRKIEVEKYEDQ